MTTMACIGARVLRSYLIISCAKLSYSQLAHLNKRLAATHSDAHQDFEGDDVARLRAAAPPLEEIALDNLDVVLQSGLLRSYPLSLRQLGGNLDNAVLCPCEHLRVVFPQIPQRVEHEGAVTRAKLVYDEVLVWVLVHLVRLEDGRDQGLGVVRLRREFTFLARKQSAAIDDLRETRSSNLP